mmetsp:Transcript_36643/g.88810  ORF Transcript_36643/g.88810 Transcript_36643/m.88810 type:complete len:396 (-) Transcript_36643:559-1746(-)
MLRLLNAKSCERGKECFGYHLEHERSDSLIGASIRPFGMAICTPCMQALSASLCTNTPACLRNDQLCTHTNLRLLSFPQLEQTTGEAVGPMLLFRDFKRIENSYSQDTKRKEVLASTIKVATGQAIAPEDEERAQRFIAAHKEAKSQYHGHRSAIDSIETARKEAAAAKRAVRKQELARPVFQQLQSEFSGFKYESLVLSCDWCKDTGLCTFRQWPSKLALGSLLSAPSSAKPKNILAAVASAKKLYATLEGFGFLGDNYPNRLHQWLDSQDGIPHHEEALVRYVAEYKSSDFILAAESISEMQDSIAEGSRTRMILNLLSGEECCEAFAFALNPSKEAKKHKLAKHVWKRKTRNLVGFNGLVNFGTIFNESKIEYNSLLRRNTKTSTLTQKHGS